MMTMYPTIRVKRVNPDADIPQYAYTGDAGVDLQVMEDVTLYPGETVTVGCGLAFAIPRGWVGLIVPRSSMGCRGLELKNTVGVIDSGYRDEVRLPLYNNNPTHTTGRIKVKEGVIEARVVPNHQGSVSVSKGERVAQMLFVRVGEATIVEADALDETERGSKGFGSSGSGRL